MQALSFESWSHRVFLVLNTKYEINLVDDDIEYSLLRNMYDDDFPPRMAAENIVKIYV